MKSPSGASPLLLAILIFFSFTTQIKNYVVSNMSSSRKGNDESTSSSKLPSAVLPCVASATAAFARPTLKRKRIYPSANGLRGEPDDEYIAEITNAKPGRRLIRPTRPAKKSRNTTSPSHDSINGLKTNINNYETTRRKNNFTRNNSFGFQRGTRSVSQSRPKAAGGLSHIIPPLCGPVGAPELPVLTTKDPRIIERWLVDNCPTYAAIDSNQNTPSSILGFDIESLAKPPWRPERASLPDGPATIQLSTPTSCIIVPLSRCGPDGSVLHAPEIVRDVIMNEKVIKVGVGIDDDALELFRWSRKGYEDSLADNAKRGLSNGRRIPTPEVKLWKMKSRFDMGCVLPDPNPSRRAGLRELALTVLGVNIPKSKKLAMSNWCNRHLTMEQISYAARDAWVAAAVVERLQKMVDDSSTCVDAKVDRNDTEKVVNTFHPDCLLSMEFLKGQRDVFEIDERATRRKAAKEELKEIQEMERERKVTDSGEGIADVKENDSESVKAKIEELHGILDFYRPDQPPSFDEALFSMPFY
mmetsp:Transcript_20570/g.42030  ORF Transcript_20570/g.42030 Transcript_20570/m.42030 type:complete len:528 (+) Transcript_20570:35-1618(+)